MARPQSDVDAGRAMLLDVLEEMVRQRGAVSVSLTALAAEAGMSPANIYRFFSNKEALFEAAAERWFEPKIRIMEEVVASDQPIERKLCDFFGRRFDLMRTNYRAEPVLFLSYLDLGDEHEDIVRGYVDLGDHYLALLVAEAMDAGHFRGLTIDRAVSLLNISLAPFISPRMIAMLEDRLTAEKLGQIVRALLTGLRGDGAAEAPRLVAV